MPKIDISEIAPSSQEPEEVNPLDETLTLALESPRGLELEYGTQKEARAARFRFYKRIKFLRARGVKSFDPIIIQLEENKIFLVTLPTPIIRTL